MLRRFDDTSSLATQAFERLASGMRINRAADDAAGLALSNKLAADARITSRGRLNVNDGISALHIASGAIDSISSLLVRQAELAEQAANGTYSAIQRKALYTEYAQLDLEIRRITKTTSFNGLNLFSGTNTAQYAQQMTDFTGGGGAGQLEVSADGNLITYVDTNKHHIRQLNHTTGEDVLLYDTMISPSVFSADASGRNIIFVSSQDYLGENNGGVSQLYHLDAQTGEITQLTNEQAGAAPIRQIDISADGSTVAFTSQTRYVSGEGKESATGLFAQSTVGTINLHTNAFNIIESGFTNAAGNFDNIAISADGSKVLFRTSKDGLGLNGDGNIELFVFDSANPAGVSQITDTIGGFGASGFSISNDGKVHFASGKNLNGLNPNTRTLAYEIDSNTGEIRNLFEHIGNDFDVGALTLSNDGTRAFFLSRGALTDETDNIQKYKLYEVDFTDGEILLHTTLEQTGSGNYELSQDGTAIFISSTFDFTGGNSDGSMELFYVDTTRDSSNIDIEVGEGTTGGILTELSSLGTMLEGLGSTLITTQDSATAALETAQRNIQLVSQVQGTIGAGLSRLETAGNVLEVRTQQSLLAESRIRDADIAAESAKLVRASVLQQTAATVLGQANTLPELAVQLLRG